MRMLSANARTLRSRSNNEQINGTPEPASDGQLNLTGRGAVRRGDDGGKKRGATYMYIALVYILFLSGCSESGGNPVAQIDTDSRVNEFNFPIQEWDGKNWVYSQSQVFTETVWRFTGSVSRADGRVIVAGGYMITMTNPNARRVNITIGELRFLDTNDITIADYDVSPDDDFSIDPGGSVRRSGDFEIELLSLDSLDLIVFLGIMAKSSFEVV